MVNPISYFFPPILCKDWSWKKCWFISWLFHISDGFRWWANSEQLYTLFFSKTFQSFLLRKSHLKNNCEETLYHYVKMENIFLNCQTSVSCAGTPHISALSIFSIDFFLTRFMLLVLFYTPWKYHKARGFHVFRGYKQRSVASTGLGELYSRWRSSSPEVFLGKDTPKICSKFTG